MKWTNVETEILAEAMDHEASLPSMIRLVGAKNRWYMIVKTVVEAVGQTNAAEELLSPIKGAYEEELRHLRECSEDLEDAEKALPLVDPGDVDWLQLATWLVAQFVGETRPPA